MELMVQIGGVVGIIGVLVMVVAASFYAGMSYSRYRAHRQRQQQMEKAQEEARLLGQAAMARGMVTLPQYRDLGAWVFNTLQCVQQARGNDQTPAERVRTQMDFVSRVRGNREIFPASEEDARYLVEAVVQHAAQELELEMVAEQGGDQ